VDACALLPCRLVHLQRQGAQGGVHTSKVGVHGELKDLCCLVTWLHTSLHLASCCFMPQAGVYCYRAH
jgi:hypothetical protein